MKPEHVQEIPGPYNLVEMFETAVAKFADRELFGTKDKETGSYNWVTYREVGRRVDRLRGGLAKLGVGAGDAVAIIANNRVEWAVCAYATYGRGARFIPMYEAELDRIWKYIIADSGTKVLFVSTPEIRDRVRGFPAEIEGLQEVVLIEGEGEGTMAHVEALGEAEPVESVKPDGEEIAGLIYTSGTTGNPKGVLLSHRNLASNVLSSALLWEDYVDREHRTLSFLPWAHSFGQTAELHLLVHMGASTGFAEAPTTIVGDLALVRPTLLLAVPRVFNKVYAGLRQKMEESGGLGKMLFEMGLNAAERKRSAGDKAGFFTDLKLKIADRIVFQRIRDRFGGRLQLAVSGSAALSPKIGQFFEDIGIPVYEGYGLTETSPGATMNAPHCYRLGSVGRPMPGCWLAIDRTLTGEDSKDGEVVVYGPNVMKGYHNLPEVTAEVIRPDGGLATGDRGWIDEDGYLYITGRIKEQYKLENGKYVFPSGLEESIKLSPYIEAAMVYGANRPHNVAVVVPDFLVLGPWAREAGLPEDPAELVKEAKVAELMLEEIRSQLTDAASYEVPKQVLVLHEPWTTETGVLTPTLKVKRRVVHERWGDRIDDLYGSPSSNEGS